MNNLHEKCEVCCINYVHKACRIMSCGIWIFSPGSIFVQKIYGKLLSKYFYNKVFWFVLFYVVPIDVIWSVESKISITSAVANLTLLRRGASPHMVLVYTAHNTKSGHLKKNKMLLLTKIGSWDRATPT